MRNFKTIAKKLFLCMFGAAIALTFFSACKANDDDEDETPVVTGITLDKNSINLATYTYNTATLTATVSGTNLTDEAKAITWTSSDSSIATVVDGAVTAVGAGTATITAASSYNTSVSASCTVTVVAADSSTFFPTGVTLSESSFSIDLSTDTTTKALTATVSPDNVTSGFNTVTWSSSNESVATVDSNGTVTGIKTGTATITVTTWGGYYSATCKVTVTGANVISASDTPTGYAGYGYETSPYYTGNNTITINASDTSAASKLNEYAKKGNYVIYINGMIDMTYNSTYGGSMLPASWDDDNAALGKFIAAQYSSSTMTSVSSAYTSWSAWRQAYAAACTTSTDYDSKTAKTASTIDRYQYELVTAWKKQIQIEVASNTTIIGLTSESGIKGGTISISGVSNVVLRNLHLQDAFDPFPHHENSDGWNAEYDCITVQDTNSYIWIDHCTFEDTISVGWTNFAGVKTGSNVAAQAYSTSNSDYEMWQTYDGLCDIKGKSTNITVSYCVFRNHDKTMLIGYSDKEFGSGNTVSDSGRTITLHHNYFYGCVQRLPMARLSYIHNYNNYYGVNSSNGYDQKAAVNARYGVYINSEYNYFDSGMKYSYNSSDSTANLYYANDYTASGVKTSLSNLTSSTSTPVFTVPYSYTPDATSTLQSDLESNAGAGVWTVKQ